MNFSVNCTQLTCYERNHSGYNVPLEAVKQNPLVFDYRIVHSHEDRNDQSSQQADVARHQPHFAANNKHTHEFCVRLLLDRVT